MAKPAVSVRHPEPIPEWVDRQADRFEAAWRSGAAPKLADFLAGESVERCELLALELIKIDLERRFRAGDRRTVHAYAEELAGLVGSGSPIWSELDRFARDLDGATNSWSPASPDPGFIGKYRVIERIAAGGQATVFRAVHPTLSRDVAIKWSHRTAAEGDRDELVAEGRLLAEIDHPNLVRVHDLDFHEHRPFLVMDYVRGQTLKQFAEHNRLTPRRAAALVALVARAITAVHRRGITHQDLKPQNILITDDGEPKVLDFGLARLRRLWADETDQPGGGTLAYMAPEQARCEFDKVGPWTDVFALGAVLYSLLTDQAPFQDADPLARLERARACLFDKTAMRQAGTPRRLETICLKAMDAEPGNRYESAGRLAGNLERFVRRPRRIAVAVGGLVAFCLIALGVWTFARPGPKPDPPRPPVQIDLEVELVREGRQFRLLEAGSARTGDEILVRVDAPTDLYLTLFWVDSAGTLQELTPLTPGRAQTVGLKPPSGSEVLVVCGSRSGLVPVDLVRQAWAGTSGWPRLPTGSLLRLSNDEVRVLQRGRDPVLLPNRADPDPFEVVRDRLEVLRARLRGRCDIVEGIAFTHETGPDRDE